MQRSIIVTQNQGRGKKEEQRVVMEDLLPPGFRFYPTEEELITFYLRNKLDPTREDLNRLIDRVIPILDIYDNNPWHLPQLSGVLCHGDPEQWFFFIPRQESEARGGRPKRLTSSGYWKATGSPGFVYSTSNNRIVGVKRTMVFYNGRAPTGTKTEWKMNEYKAIEGDASASSTTNNVDSMLRHEFSLCRIYKKSKSLRAFDRRPSISMIHDPPVLPPNQQLFHGEGASSSLHPISPGPLRERTGSFDYSSSGDENPPSQAGEQVLLNSIDWFSSP